MAHNSRGIPLIFASIVPVGGHPLQRPVLRANRNDDFAPNAAGLQVAHGVGGL